MKRYGAALSFMAGMLAMAHTLAAAEGPTVISYDIYSFELPRGWQRSKYQPKATRHNKEKIMVVTKDGVSLESIEFGIKKVDSPFRYTKKKFAEGMMPHEMAEVVLNDFELNETMKNLNVYEKKPATLCGMPAFRMVFSYREEGSLQYKCVYYGFQRENMFYSIRYVAPFRHYFDTYLATFEQVVRSIKTPDQRDNATFGP